MKFEGTICVVAGGTSGLGLAAVKKLVGAGAYVAVLDLQDKQNTVEKWSTKARFYKTDVTNTNEIEATIANVVEWGRLLKARIAAVVCCAGILGPAKILSRNNTPFSIDTFKKVIDINLVGTVDVIRQILPQMASQDADNDGERGVVITVSSAAAFDGQPGQVAYSAAKGAIASMMLPMARDLARHGIRSVAISPGMFETSMTINMPDKARQSLQKVMEFPSRPGRPDEFAELVEHVIANSMLNGTVIRIDGATRMPSRL